MSRHSPLQCLDSWSRGPMATFLRYSHVVLVFKCLSLRSGGNSTIGWFCFVFLRHCGRWRRRLGNDSLCCLQNEKENFKKNKDRVKIMKRPFETSSGHVKTFDYSIETNGVLIYIHTRTHIIINK